MNKLIVIFFLLLSLIAVIINIFNIEKLHSLSKSSPSKMLSSRVLKDHVYIYYDNDHILPAFLSILDRFYTGFDVSIPEKIFKKEIFQISGLDIVNNDRQIMYVDTCDPLLKESFVSLWYNPIVFHQNEYVLSTFIPMTTDPPLSGNHPLVILFIKGDREKSNDRLIFVRCKDYIVFLPESRLSLLGLP